MLERIQHVVAESIQREIGQQPIRIERLDEPVQVAVAAIEEVVARSTGEEIISSLAFQAVVAIPGDQRVGSVTAEQRHIAHEEMRVDFVGQCAAGELHRRNADVLVCTEWRAPLDLCRGDGDVGVAGGHFAEDIVTRFTFDRIVARAARQLVVAASGFDRVVAGSAVDHVGIGRAGQRIVAIATRQRHHAGEVFGIDLHCERSRRKLSFFDAANAVRSQAAEHCVAEQRIVERDRAFQVRRDDAIGAAVAVDDVVAGVQRDYFVTVVAGDDVVAVATHHHKRAIGLRGVDRVIAELALQEQIRVRGEARIQSHRREQVVAVAAVDHERVGGIREQEFFGSVGQFRLAVVGNAIVRQDDRVGIRAKLKSAIGNDQSVHNRLDAVVGDHGRSVDGDRSVGRVGHGV